LGEFTRKIRFSRHHENLNTFTRSGNYSRELPTIVILENNGGHYKRQKNNDSGK